MSNYPYIRAHGRLMGSNTEWIGREVERARADKAPADAVYYSIDRERWITAAEYRNREYVTTMNRTIEQFGIKE